MHRPHFCGSLPVNLLFKQYVKLWAVSCDAADLLKLFVDIPSMYVCTASCGKEAPSQHVPANTEPIYAIRRLIHILKT